MCAFRVGLIMIQILCSKSESIPSDILTLTRIYRLKRALTFFEYELREICISIGNIVKEKVKPKLLQFAKELFETCNNNVKHGRSDK